MTRSTSAAKTSKDTSYAFGNGRMSTSQGGSAGKSRMRVSSLRRRRSRFRSTTDRLYFGTMTPTRAYATGEAATRTSRCSVLIRSPVRLIVSISIARDRRCARASVLRACVLRRQLDRQPLAPLLPATGEDLTPPPCRHALTKAVCLNPALVTRPVRGLTHNSPSVWRK